MLFSCPVCSLKQRVLQWNPWGKCLECWKNLQLDLGCVTIHWHQQEHQGLGCVTTHWHQQEHQGLGCVITHGHQQEHQGLGCVTTHWHQQEHKPYIKILLCSAVTWGVSSVMIISSLHNRIHPLEMVINPLKMVCGCPHGETIKKAVTHAILSPYGMYLSINHCMHIYQLNPRVFSLGMWQLMTSGF